MTNIYLDIKTSMADSNTDSLFGHGPLNFSGVQSLVFGVATYWNIINVMIGYNDLDRIEKDRTDE